MIEGLQLGLEYAYALLFVWVFAEQMGLPLPAIPILVAAGSLVSSGRLNFPLALGLVVSAALLADILWYHLGLRGGAKTLRLVCRLSLKPEVCVRRSETVFARYGSPWLLVAKFIPGLNTAAPPLAGAFRMGLSRFLVWDGLGALLWVLVYGGLGYVLREQLEEVAAWAFWLSKWLLVIVGGAFAIFVTWRLNKIGQSLRT